MFRLLTHACRVGVLRDLCIVISARGMFSIFRAPAMVGLCSWTRASRLTRPFGFLSFHKPPRDEWQKRLRVFRRSNARQRVPTKDDRTRRDPGTKDLYSRVACREDARHARTLVRSSHANPHLLQGGSTSAHKLILTGDRTTRLVIVLC